MAITNDTSSDTAINGICHIQTTEWEDQEVLSLSECNKPGGHVFVFNERYNATNHGNWSKWPNLELAEVEVFVEQGKLES